MAFFRLTEQAQRDTPILAIIVARYGRDNVKWVRHDELRLVDTFTIPIDGLTDEDELALTLLKEGEGKWRLLANLYCTYAGLHFSGN